VTNITDQGSGGAALNVTGASATNFVEVSGFTFTNGGATNHGNGMVQIAGTMFDQGFRFHHNKVTHSSVGRGLYIYFLYGVADHNIFEVTGSVGLQTVSIDGSNVGSDGGFTPWKQPLTMGTVNAVYLEDNTFTNTAAASTGEDTIDTYSGARVVIRHNIFTNAHHGFHGTDSGNIRSPVSFEIYENAYTNNTGSAFSGMQIRGGTGVVFNNSYSGSFYGSYNIVYHRTDGSGNTSAWQNCDGTRWEIGSLDFNAQASRACSTNGGVHFCSGNRDIPCTGDGTCSALGAGTCTEFFDTASGSGYPCRDQPGIGPGGQVSAPLYQWNNTGNAPTFGSSNSLMVANRDYFNGIPKPGYTAFTYPHPLQSGQIDTTKPAAPRNLTVN